MDFIVAMRIGAKQGPNEQHGRAGCSHPTGQDGAYRQQGGIHLGSAYEIAGQTDSPGHGKQGEQQQNERDIFQQDGMDDLIERHARPKRDRTGNRKRQAPKNRNFTEVMMPDMRSQKGHERNGQQHADKGYNPDNRKLSPVQKMFGAGRLG